MPRSGRSAFGMISSTTGRKAQSGGQYHLRIIIAQRSQECADRAARSPGTVVVFHISARSVNVQDYHRGADTESEANSEAGMSGRH